MKNFGFGLPISPPIFGSWNDRKNLMFGGTLVGTRYQRGRRRKRGGFSIRDLDPTRVVKKARSSGLNLVKNKITKVANKQIKKQLTAQGRKIGVSPKAAGVLTDALTFVIREQLDKRIK